MSEWCATCRFGSKIMRGQSWSAGELGKFKRVGEGVECRRFPSFVERWGDQWCGEYQPQDKP